MTKAICAMILISICFFVMGCRTLESVRASNREKLGGLAIDMTKEDALKVMGTRTVKTYDRGYPDPKSVITNPYRSEAFKVDSKIYDVLYYYTDINSKDGAIANDELTPLVFEDEQLIGWGRTFLDEAVVKYEEAMKEN